ncbi:MAG: thioesterase [Alphaproteobacteria bacterium]|nr:thioesterase [Alphaproteobacteria bacterium]
MTEIVIEAPTRSWRGMVKPEWIDHHSHMNAGYYGVVFETIGAGFMRTIGLGPAYRDRTPYGFYVIETHVSYLRELHADAPLVATTQLLDFDAKRLRSFHTLYNEAEGFVAATGEMMALHIDRRTRRSTPMPEDITALFRRIMEVHSALPAPPRAGRGISMARPGA